jgi:hypothetical protein
LEDDLMRIFGSERIGRILQTMGLKKDQAIVHPWISKAIAKAQQKVESFHFDVRKNLLKYDDVMNEQRKIIYEQRRQLLEAESVHDIISDMRRDAFESVVYSLAPERSAPEDWNTESLHQEVLKLANIDAPFDSWKAEPGMMLFEMKMEDGKPIHLNTMRAQIPLSFDSIREVSCFLNLIARAFATSLDRIDIDNGLYQCRLDANQIKKIHQLHYFPNRVEFRELYQTLVFPWFPTEERRISALEKYYDAPFEDFILRRTTLLRINRNKDVELPFINKVFLVPVAVYGLI